MDFIWNSYHTPREEFWNLTERPGYLRLKVRPESLIQVLEMPPYEMKIGPSARQKELIIDNPSFIGRRQQHMDFEANTKMEFKPQNEKETAGVALIQNDNHHFRFEYTIDGGQKVIRLVKHTAKVDMDFVAKTFSYENKETKLAQEAFDSEVIYLKVTAKGQDYSFYYGESLHSMKVLMENVDGRILCSEVASGCSGTYMGMFASSNGEVSDNVADFDYFEYQGEN